MRPRRTLSVALALALLRPLALARALTLTQVEEPVDGADTEMGSCAPRSPSLPPAPESDEDTAPKA
jgi:hypothetical protein